MTTYAMIAKFQGAPAIYLKDLQPDGTLGASDRYAEGLADYAQAKKLVDREGFVLVKSWKDAAERAETFRQAEDMTPEQPLEWKNKVNGWHRAKTEDGTYNIRRWFLKDGEWVPGPANGAAVGESEDRMWRISFDHGAVDAEDVPWWKPADELVHSLEHAKQSCQLHANARLLAAV